MSLGGNENYYFRKKIDLCHDTDETAPHLIWLRAALAPLHVYCVAYCVAPYIIVLGTVAALAQLRTGEEPEEPTLGGSRVPTNEF
jgi:hypothetical protein